MYENIQQDHTQVFFQGFRRSRKGRKSFKSLNSLNGFPAYFHVSFSIRGIKKVSDFTAVTLLFHSHIKSYRPPYLANSCLVCWNQCSILTASSEFPHPFSAFLGNSWRARSCSVNPRALDSLMVENSLFES